MAKRIERQLSFFLDEFGEKVVLNGEEKKALVRDAQDKIDYYNDKIIRTPFEIHTGNIVNYQQKEWLLISEIDRDKKSFRARMRKVNYHIHFVLNGDLYTFPTIIEGGNFGLDVDRTMILQEGKILVTMPLNDGTKKIEVDHRFITMGSAWKVTGVDRSKLGLVILHCEKDVFSHFDDKENEIANANLIAQWQIILVTESNQITVGQTKTIETIIKRNDEVITTEEVIWESSDESKLTVENGEMTAIDLGNVRITAKLKRRPTIQTSVEIEVVESTPDIITYKFWSSNTDGTSKSYTNFSIYSNHEKIFGVEKYINGELAVPNDTYAFYVDPNGSPSGRYTYTIENNETIKIKATGVWSSGIKLTAMSNETGDAITETIRLVSPW